MYGRSTRRRSYSPLFGPDGTGGGSPPASPPAPPAGPPASPPAPPAPPASPPAPPAGPPASPPASPPAAPPASPPVAPEVQALIDSHTAAARRQAESDTEARVRAQIAREQAEATATANNDFKALAESRATTITERDAEIVRLKGELQQRDHQVLMHKVARQFGLPQDLADRLQGKTEAELTEDAKKLASVAGIRIPPSTETGGHRHGSPPAGPPAGPPASPPAAPTKSIDGRPLVAWND